MNNNVKWNFPYGKITLLKNEVHIWRSKLLFTTKQLNNFFSFLSNDEKNKAFKFSFKSDMNNYVASKAILRLILSRYLNLSPVDIVFYKNYYGKPFVLDKKIGFNMSHSNEYAIYAIAEHKMIGIDIEYIKESFDELAIAGKFFSNIEVQELKSVPEISRKEAFFNCWTRKEAFIKAKGTGLSTPLDSFDVSVISRESAESISIKMDNEEQNDWYLQNLNITSGYSSALVSQKKPDSIKYWDWNYTIEVIDRYSKTGKASAPHHERTVFDKIIV